MRILRADNADRPVQRSWTRILRRSVAPTAVMVLALVVALPWVPSAGARATPLVPSHLSPVAGGALLSPPSPRVHPALTVSLTISPDPTNIGQSTFFYAIVSGGTSPYSYSWSGMPSGPGCTPGTSTSSFYCYPNSAGYYYVGCTVSDSVGATGSAYAGLSVASSGFSVMVDIRMANGRTLPPGLTPPAPLPLELYASEYGSIRYPLTYHWNLGDGSPSSGAQDVYHTYNASGSYTAAVTVTDAGGSSGTGYGNFTVGPYVAPPSVVTIVLNPPTVALGGKVSFSVNVQGGWGYNSLIWLFLPSGCPNPITSGGFYNTNFTSFTCQPAFAGSYLVTVYVLDEAGRNGTGSAPLTVSPASGSGGSGGIAGSSFSPLDLGLTSAVAGLAVLSVALGMLLLKRGRHPGMPPRMFGGGPPAPPWASAEPPPAPPPPPG